MEDRAGRGIRSRDPFDQRIDQWMETGRQFVDGVSGRRPGQRRASVALDSVGRWVGEKVDWLLDDDDDWREPWQDTARTSMTPPSRSPSRRPLDAISRRTRPMSSAAPAPVAPPADRTPQPDRPTDNSQPGVDQGWPEDESFRVQRWQRSRLEPMEPEVAPARPTARRALPRSSRRRD